MSRVEDLHRNFERLNGKCYLCGESLAGKGRLFYIAGGAVADSEDPVSKLLDESPARLKASLHIHSHGRNSKNDVGVTVVDDVDWGQFDVIFCSIGCFRTWMLEVLVLIESTAGAGD